MAKKRTYQDAYEELAGIVKALEEDRVPIDEMAGKVKKAAELVRICKEKLQVTEQEVNEILKELQPEEE